MSLGTKGYFVVERSNCISTIHPANNIQLMCLWLFVCTSMLFASFILFVCLFCTHVVIFDPIQLMCLWLFVCTLMLFSSLMLFVCLFHTHVVILDPAFRQCVLCREDVCNPQLLPCLHSVCEKCLSRVTNNDGVVKCVRTECENLVCTSDKIVSNAPLQRLTEGCLLLNAIDSGEISYCGSKRHVKDGEDVSAVAYCLNCQKFFCSKCLDAHNLLDICEGHKVRMVGKSSNYYDEGSKISETFMKEYEVAKCRYHEGKSREFYCETCDVTVCQVCIVEGHTEHKPKFLKTYKIPPLLNAVKVSKAAALNWESKCLQQVSNLEDRQEEINQSADNAIAATEELFTRLSEALNERRVRVLQEIAHATVVQTSVLDRAIEDLRLCLSTLHCSSTFLRFFEDLGSTEELLALRKIVDLHATHLHSRCFQTVVPPAQSNTLKIQFGNEVESLLEKLSKLGEIDLGPDPSQCVVMPHLAGLVHKMADLDLVLQVHAQGSREVTELDGHVTAFLRSTSTCSPTIKGNVVTVDGTCLVKFKKFYTGICELDVMLDGRHVNSSPFKFTLLVIPSVESLGVARGTLPLPVYQGLTRVVGGYARVAVSSRGEIFVVDNNRDTIHVLTKRMELLGDVPQCRGRISRPRTVSVDDDGQVFVSHSHVVDLFKPDGSVVSIGKGVLHHPWDVAVSQSGEIFVSDAGNHRVVVFSPDGSSVRRTFGRDGDECGRFNLPSGIAFLPNGNVAIGDTENNRIQIFTQKGEFVKAFGHNDVFQPRQLIATVEGYVLCASSASYCVAVFNSRGRLLKTFGSRGNRLGEFREPKGLAVSFDGNILVSEGEGYRVQVF